MLKPTDEQQAIIDADETNSLAVDALAGAAKTTTLEMRAKAHPNQRILYVALNKAVQMEAQARFPSNVTCKTTHGLAFRTHGVPLKHKLGNVRPVEVSEAMGRFASERGDKISLAANAIETVKRFCASADEQIDELHTSGGRFDPNTVVEAAGMVWDMMIDPSNRFVSAPHDAYLKLFQLSNPDLSDRFDAIYLDEAQDTNPAMYAVFAGQHGLQRVAVGDRNQSIYRFRGSMDVMSQMSDADRYSLTGSFRFGPEVAEVANVILGLYLGENLVLRGLGSETLVTTADDEALPESWRTYLARTNAGLFSKAVQLLDEGHEVMHWLGGIESYGMETLLDLYRISIGRRGEVRDRFLKMWSSLDALRQYAEEVDDKELKARLTVVDNYGRRLPRLVTQLRRAASDKLDTSDPALTTAHRSKGREFPNVVLLEDFNPLFASGNEGEYPLIPEWIPKSDKRDPVERDELYLTYVAATRAQKGLGLNDDLARLMRWRANETIKAEEEGVA